jgi:hypothetical protein
MAPGREVATNVPGTFAHPFMYWVGMDNRSTDADELRAFHQYYGHTHVPEVVAHNPGFVLGHRYQLRDPDRRGDRGPMFIAAYEIADGPGAQTYMDRNDGPAEGRPSYTPGPPVWSRIELRWRMIWRQIAATGPVAQPPASIFVVGIDPPFDADAAALAEFNDFYTHVHVPEVVANWGYTRATRYELARQFLHPAPGAPRYCAVYESDDPAAPTPSAGKVPESSGPAVWRDHTTPWRLTYRRLT